MDKLYECPKCKNVRWVIKPVNNIHKWALYCENCGRFLKWIGKL